MFLPPGEVSGVTLSLRLVADILYVTKRAVSVVQQDQWWIVASEYDWIRASQGEVSIEEYFTRLIPFPQAGVNTAHGEVLLTAFATRLVTATPSESPLPLIGAAPEDSLIAGVARALPHWCRLVAFQL
jgi:hypothetical protein